MMWVHTSSQSDPHSNICILIFVHWYTDTGKWVSWKILHPPIVLKRLFRTLVSTRKFVVICVHIHRRMAFPLWRLLICSPDKLFRKNKNRTETYLLFTQIQYNIYERMSGAKIYNTGILFIFKYIVCNIERSHLKSQHFMRKLYCSICYLVLCVSVVGEKNSSRS